MYITGANLQDHWVNISNNHKEYDLRKIGKNYRIWKPEVSLEEILNNEKWDIITIQQGSDLSGNYTTYEPYLTDILNWLSERSQAKLYFHQTWAYGQEKKDRYGNDQMEMFEEILSSVNKVNENHPEIIDIIPTGTAIQNMRTSIGDVLNRDGWHLELTYGRYTAACTWFEKLTGIDVRSNPYFPSSIDLPMKVTVQEAVHQAILNPYDITEISPIVYAEDISINLEEFETIIGESVKLEAEVIPDNATYKTILWTSSNERVAVVNEEGIVKAIGEGNALVSANCGNISKSCFITIYNPIVEVENIVLNSYNLEILIGETFKLEATILPEDATDKSVKWESSDASIATVSEEGIVSAIKEGVVTVRAICGNIISECSVEVLNLIINAQKVIISQNNLEIIREQNFQLTAEIFPEDTTDKTVIWTTSDPDIVSISDEGLMYTHSVGEAFIYATCGEVSDVCNVKVKRAPVESMELSAYNLEMNDEIITIEANIFPEQASGTPILWFTSNDNILFISSDWCDETERSSYVIIDRTILQEGHSKITAKAGDISRTCEITLNTLFHTNTIKDLKDIKEDDNVFSVYTFDGILLNKKCRAEDIKKLSKGIYFLVNGSSRYKIIL